MHSNVYKALTPHLTLGPQFVDSLIISSFIVYHGLDVEYNQLLINSSIPLDGTNEAEEILRLFFKVVSEHTDN
jgi:hypothetical protein